MQCNKTLSVVTDLFFVVHIFIQLYGLLSPIDNLVYLGSGVLWFVFAYIENEYVLSKAFFSKPNIILLFFILFFCGLRSFVNPLSTAVAATIATYLQYGSFVMALFYIFNNDHERLVLLVKVAFAIILAFTINGIIFFQQHPGIARAMLDNLSLVIRGIGGNSYSLAISINAITLFYINKLLRESVVVKYFIIALIFALSVVLTLSVDSATTCFTYFACVAISILNIYVFKDAKSEERILLYFKKISLYLLIVAVFLTMSQNISQIILDLSQKMNFAGPFVVDRLEKVAWALVGYDLGKSFEARSYLRMLSIEAFINHPFIGIEIFPYDGRIGQHSEFFDLLGRFGVIGCVPLFTSLGLAVKKLYFRNGLTYFSPIILYIIINGVMNPMHYPQTLFVILCFIPLLIERYKKGL